MLDKQLFDRDPRAAIAKATIDEGEAARTTKFFNDRHDARVAAGNQSLFKD